MRGHDAQHQLGTSYRIRQTIDDINLVWDQEAGKVDVVFARSLHPVGEVRFIDPQPQISKPGGQHDRQSGAPTSAADDGERLHGYGLPPNLKTCSAPERSR